MSAAKDYTSTEVCLAFKDFSASSLVPPSPVLSNVSGFVAKGGITAVFGASSSGKSLLLQALAGRVQSLAITGDVFLNGLAIDPSSTANSISYVPQGTMLIGDLTAREMVSIAARMKVKKPMQCIEQNVNDILNNFGLGAVADNYIGSIFRSGLSGGQKRRVDVAVELVSAPSLLLLDEPTSGLDGSISWEVLSAIRSTVKGRSAANPLSVMLTIHQPNSRILELFDHIMVLGNSGMVFFGTVAESVQHFTRIGFAPPAKYTPTDYYLNVIDTNFSVNKFDFVGAFNSSEKFLDIIDLVTLVQSRGQMEQLLMTLGTTETDTRRSLQSVADSSAAEAEAGKEDPTELALSRKANCRMAGTETSMCTQMWVLIARDFTIAARDPTLYYLQVALVLLFGVLVGAVFFDLKYRVDESMNYVPSGLLWIVMMTVYIQIFKVYHMNKANERYAHEHANGYYTPFAYWCAELLTVAMLLVSYLPGTAIAYFMMGLPGKAYPFIMLLMWMSALTSESLLLFVTKFYKDISASVVTGQLVLVLLTAFGAGLFIRWSDVPAYWEWLQALSLFTHSSRAAMLSVMRKLTYECRLAGDGNCYGPSGELFACLAGSVSGDKCEVSGSTVLLVTQNVPLDESYWRPFGYLVVLFVGFRLAVLFMMYVPFERLVFYCQKLVNSPNLLVEVLQAHLKVAQLEQRVARLMRADHFTYAPVAAAESGASTPQNAEAQQTSAPTATKTAARLSWTNLNLVLKKGGKKLIDDVSGSVPAGTVLALMGPSGAGKTTLLNALANRAPYADVTGEVNFGGAALTSRDLMYVPQFDEIKGYATVVEQMELVGLMKCEDRRAMRRRLLKLLQILGLFERANVLCKDLTGGEQKRLSVGMGMICNPKVLFLDEPTTGLDSTAAFYMVQYLVALARDLQLPVIMTIHQPAAIVFDMLPDLYLLEGGRLAFFGPIATAQGYFASLGHACPSGVNPADFYLDLIYKPPPTGSSHDSWRDMYTSSTHGQQVSRQLLQLREDEERAPAAVQVYDEPSSWQRFLFLTAFFARYFLVNPGYYVFRLVYLVLCAVYIGTLYLDLDTNTSELVKYSGAIFFSIWATLFAAVGGTGLVASDRRQAFEQIKNGVVSPAVSCAATFVASIPFNVVCAFAFQLIFHWVSNINPSGESFIYAVILTMLHMVMMEAIMAIVVEVVRDAMLAVTCAMVVMGTLFLFPGFFIQVSAMPEWVSWISWIMPTKYSFDGYLRIIFYTQDFDVLDTGMVISGRDVLAVLFNNKDVNAWGMIGVLLAYIALFRLAHYGLFLYASLPFLNAAGAAPRVRKSGAVGSAAYEGVAKSEVEMV